MKRYWLPRECGAHSDSGAFTTLEMKSLESNIPDKFVIHGEYFHHIHKVCRNDKGSKFEVLLGDGKAYFVEFVEVGKKSGIAEVREVREIKPLPKPDLNLAISIPRFHKLDWIIEKSVELGVTKLWPFVSDYSFVKSLDSSLNKKSQRWQKIIQSATQQSGRGEMMEIAPPQKMDSLLDHFNQSPSSRGLFPYEGSSTQSIMEGAKKISGQENLQNVWAFIGSEGGFSEGEVEKFQAVGLEPTTLGDQVLRVDTACLAVLAILKYELKHLE